MARRSALDIGLTVAQPVDEQAVALRPGLACRPSSSSAAMSLRTVAGETPRSRRSTRADRLLGVDVVDDGAEDGQLPGLVEHRHWSPSCWRSHVCVLRAACSACSDAAAAGGPGVGGPPTTPTRRARRPDGSWTGTRLALAEPECQSTATRPPCADHTNGMLWAGPGPAAGPRWAPGRNVVRCHPLAWALAPVVVDTGGPRRDELRADLAAGPMGRQDHHTFGNAGSSTRRSTGTRRCPVCWPSGARRCTCCPRPALPWSGRRTWPSSCLPLPTL